MTFPWDGTMCGIACKCFPGVGKKSAQEFGEPLRSSEKESLWRKSVSNNNNFSCGMRDTFLMERSYMELVTELAFTWAWECLQLYKYE